MLAPGLMPPQRKAPIRPGTPEALYNPGRVVSAQDELDMIPDLGSRVKDSVRVLHRFDSGTLGANLVHGYGPGIPGAAGRYRFDARKRRLVRIR